MPEPRQYTAGEKARLAALVARAGVAMGRGRSMTAVDRAIEKLKAEACAREAEQDRRRAEADAKKQAEKIARRADRRFW